VPVWHKATRPWVEQGRLVVLGVIQEQHAERCRLFAQWQQFDWPILHDPVNALELAAVPVVIALDEHGIVRSTRPRPETFEADFLDMQYDNDAAEETSPAVLSPSPPDLAALRKRATAERSARDWRNLGDALLVWRGGASATEAIEAYRQALVEAPDNADALFRHGVAYRVRFDSPQRQPGDFQRAVQAWESALSLNPNQYIWRRRIQQYGPRLDKPYPFYDWCQTAQAEVAARGETPIALTVPPGGAEIATPSKRFLVAQPPDAQPDPKGQINRDQLPLIRSDVTVVPSRPRPGQIARVHISLRPDAERQAHWNNEAEPLRLWLDPPEGWQASDRRLSAEQGAAPETAEPRGFDFELHIPSAAREPGIVRAYALYYACEGLDGTCVFLRQDIDVRIDVDTSPP
jgi:tetratricopeptide (TPR) repeat protein